MEQLTGRAARQAPPRRRRAAEPAGTAAALLCGHWCSPVGRSEAKRFMFLERCSTAR